MTRCWVELSSGKKVEKKLADDERRDRHTISTIPKDDDDEVVRQAIEAIEESPGAVQNEWMNGNRHVPIAHRASFVEGWRGGEGGGGDGVLVNGESMSLVCYWIEEESERRYERDHRHKIIKVLSSISFTSSCSSLSSPRPPLHLPTLIHSFISSAMRLKIVHRLLLHIVIIIIIEHHAGVLGILKHTRVIWRSKLVIIWCDDVKVLQHCRMQ